MDIQDKSELPGYKGGIIIIGEQKSTEEKVESKNKEEEWKR